MPGLFDDPVKELKESAIEQWDYSSCFPPGYSGIPGPIFVQAWPWQLDQQLEILSNNGQLTRPIISICLAPSHDLTRTFSDQYGGPGIAVPTIARRGCLFFAISSWADQQLGGIEMCRSLASQVQGAMMYYRNRLTTVRHLKTVHSHDVFDDGAQLWQCALTVEGDSFVSINI
jgi:hypothetical protein